MMLSLVGVALAAFALTNVDAFVILTALFATSSRTRVQWMIVGQFVGFIAILAMSAAVTLGLSSFPATFAAVFGLVPLGLGLRGLWALRRREPGATAEGIRLGLLGVAAVMIGNGGDNVAVLAPLFRTLGLAHSLVVSAVLIALDAVMCATALVVGQRSIVVRGVRRVGDVAVPLLYAAIGIALLLRAGPPASFAWYP